MTRCDHDHNSSLGNAAEIIVSKVFQDLHLCREPLSCPRLLFKFMFMVKSDFSFKAYFQNQIIDSRNMCIASVNGVGGFQWSVPVRNEFLR